MNILLKVWGTAESSIFNVIFGDMFNLISCNANVYMPNTDSSDDALTNGIANICGKLTQL